MANEPAPDPPGGLTAQGKGLAVTAFAAAGLALLVPCLFGWAGILLGLAANQKGHPLGKVAVYTSIATMLIGFALTALARKYL
ncbi:hypothetical protein ACFXHA_29315 [Nocardia sp. NPDC059240]|uniref:hypothetical protein n=1 Tax=Nocardia sp. NPDC059240 TaxID=3346786 RepID=UPI003697929A